MTDTPEHTLGPLPAKVPVDRHLPTGVVTYGWTEHQVRAYAIAEVAKARAEERERCAKVCETMGPVMCDSYGDDAECIQTADACAEAIRALT